MDFAATQGEPEDRNADPFSRNNIRVNVEAISRPEKSLEPFFTVESVDPKSSSEVLESSLDPSIMKVALPQDDVKRQGSFKKRAVSYVAAAFDSVIEEEEDTIEMMSPRRVPSTRKI